MQPIRCLALFGCCCYLLGGCASSPTSAAVPQGREPAGQRVPAVLVARATRLRDQLDRVRAQAPQPGDPKAMEHYLLRVEKCRFDCHHLLQATQDLLRFQHRFAYGRVVQVDHENQSLLCDVEFCNCGLDEGQVLVVSSPLDGDLGLARLEWRERGRPRLFLYRVPTWARPVQEGDIVCLERNPCMQRPASTDAGRLRRARRLLQKLAGLVVLCAHQALDEQVTAGSGAASRRAGAR